MRFSPALLAFLLLLSPAAHAVNGLTLGLEGMRGGWTAKLDELRRGNQNLLQEDAYEFSSRFDERTSSGPGLHIGWNILGHALLEAAAQGSFWQPFEKTERGGAALLGGRATWYPTRLFLEEYPEYDLGLEFGLGYAVAGGPQLAMSGMYYSLGVTAEYYPLSWLSIVLGWRYFVPRLSTFYVDFDNDQTFEVSGFSAGWNTLALGVSFHLAAPPPRERRSND